MARPTDYGSHCQDPEEAQLVPREEEVEFRSDGHLEGPESRDFEGYPRLWAPVILRS
jgi:hypothetical protein